MFIGDGVSDLPAAREADVLFARRGLRLEEYCIENKIAYIAFDTFADIQKEVNMIMVEDQQKTGGMGKPVRFNPRANLWRRVSSQKAVGISLSQNGSIEEVLMRNRSRCMWQLRRRRRRRCSCGPMHSRTTSPKLSPRALLLNCSHIFIRKLNRHINDFFHAAIHGAFERSALFWGLVSK